MNKTTLVKAYATTDRSSIMIWLFRIVHIEEIDPIQAIKTAWASWMKTDEGKEFVKNNGENFGDSLNIPDDFLADAGISKFDQLNEFGGTTVSWDKTITLDHDEHITRL